MGHVFDFVANTTDGVMAVDGDQTIVLWNASASATLGYEPSEVLGKPCYSVLRSRDAQGCAFCRRDCAVIATARRLELPQRVEVEAAAKGGGSVWLDVSTVVVPSRRRRLSVVLHFFREVTEQHESQRILHEFAGVIGRIAENDDPPVARDEADPLLSANLTRREREVLAYLAAGVPTGEIAARLHISARTVRNHISNVLVKLGVHSRLEAVTYSIRNGLL